MKRDKTKDNYDLIRSLQRRVYDLELQSPEYNHSGVTAQEAIDFTTERNPSTIPTPDSKQWIDLDIDNLPDRFFTRDDIELQFKLDSLMVTDWVNCQLEKSGRSYVIKRLTGKEVFKYRYRIQEKKEPILYITKIDMEALSMYHFNRRLALIDFAPAMNREVIIID